ncbi:MAG: hypothetical protein WA324_09800 [Bryobacteraceae bacterium]
MTNCSVRFVNVMNGAIAKPPREDIVFMFGNVSASHVKSLERTMESIPRAPTLFDPWMILEIFSVVDGSLPYLMNSGVNLANREALIARNPTAVRAL